MKETTIYLLVDSSDDEPLQAYEDKNDCRDEVKKREGGVYMRSIVMYKKDK